MPGTTTTGFPGGSGSSSTATGRSRVVPSSTTTTSTGRCSPSSSRRGSSWRTTDWRPSTRSPPRTRTASRPTAACSREESPLVWWRSAVTPARPARAGALIAARDEGLPPRPASSRSRAGFDLSVASPAVGHGPDPFLTAEWVRNRGREYAAGSVALDDPRLSPAYADLSGLPPLYLPVGSSTRCATASWRWRCRHGEPDRCHLESWPGMVHGWQGLVSARVPEALGVVRAGTGAYLDGVFDAAGHDVTTSIGVPGGTRRAAPGRHRAA